jgi:hypothetical protein
MLEVFEVELRSCQAISPAVAVALQLQLLAIALFLQIHKLLSHHTSTGPSNPTCVRHSSEGTRTFGLEFSTRRRHGGTNKANHDRINFPGLYRQNNVPKWQQIHQTHDGLRQWQKVDIIKTLKSEVVEKSKIIG